MPTTVRMRDKAREYYCKTISLEFPSEQLKMPVMEERTEREEIETDERERVCGVCVC